MPLQREMLADRTKARQEVLRASRVAKPSHTTLAFPSRLVAVLGAIVHAGGCPDEHMSDSSSLIQHIKARTPKLMPELGSGSGSLCSAAVDRWRDAQLITVDVDHHAPKRLPAGQIGLDAKHSVTTLSNVTPRRHCPKERMHPPSITLGSSSDTWRTR